MGIKAVKNRIAEIREILVDIEKKVDAKEYLAAAHASEKIDRKSDELFKEIWKAKGEDQ